jgi:hypothetical protein
MEPTSILIGLAIGAVAAYVIANMIIKKNIEGSR